MSLNRESATAFVEKYGQTWETWDVEGFVDLFSDNVVYVAHPQETVVGKGRAQTLPAQGEDRARAGERQHGRLQ